MTAQAKATTKKTKTTKPKAAAKPKAVAASKAKVSATSKAPSQTTSKAPGKSKNGKLMAVLNDWNFRLGALLVLLAAAVVVFGGSHTISITSQYLTKDSLASEAAGRTVYGAATRHLVDVHLSWVVAKFLLIFAATYLLAATIWKKRYQAWLARGVNKLRWAGLGLGGGAVMVAVLMLSGITDVLTLTLTFGLIGLAGLLAASAELMGGERRLRRLLCAGAAVAVFLPWLVFVRSIGAVPMYGAKLPLYMYFLYAVVTLLLVAIGASAHMRNMKRGKWADTAYTEKMFMILAFLTAVLPALQIFAGALQS